MKKLCLIGIIVLASLGCNARFTSSGSGGNNSQGEDPIPDPPPPPPDPKPDPWEGGFLQITCEFGHARQNRFLGSAGMMDKEGKDFRDKNWEMVQWAEEGWIWVELEFPGHDSTITPITKPSDVSVTYYLFYRPDPRVGENFYEIKRTVRKSFTLDQNIEVKWDFAKQKLKCRVHEPQQ